MKQEELEKLVGETLVANSSDKWICSLSMGLSSTIRLTSEYILRKEAVEQHNKFSSIYLQNVGTDLLSQGMPYAKLVWIISELMGVKEDIEVKLNARKKRTVCHGIVSFGTKLSTTLARDIVARFLQEHFPLNYLLAVVHQDTPETHVHINMSARNIKGEVLTLDTKICRDLSLLWRETVAGYLC